jgi:proline dehydrogenase
MYHRTLTECLRRIKDTKDRSEDAKKIAIMVASHNEKTVRFAIEKYVCSASLWAVHCLCPFTMVSWHSLLCCRMKEIGISPEDKVICFGQLLGMCDYITFPLGRCKCSGTEHYLAGVEGAQNE